MNPRRLWEGSNPCGCRESDTDYVMNNIKACVEFLEQEALRQEWNDLVAETLRVVNRERADEGVGRRYPPLTRPEGHID